ncbi:class I SAM-dependent methyltransferase [Caenispirillum bisanense]|uniref:Predicted nicotinamide N-methyase n=1 Tax=Caenispirillum bisanense TaxID=414052 RepID=A0A286GG89_9PROT|nr:50S ribosomal protein L11 methyltransferase [Caenispirillum bisanense]SOD94537.1 Predicted nicotinamide N-methyase [Caenispirillum bisanense]
MSTGAAGAVVDLAAFIRAQTVLTAPPLVPEVRLHLATEVTPLWQATQDFLDDNALPPPYWAFAWPGGQAMTRWLLDNPAVFRRRRVLDLAAGSGLTAVALAAAGAGAVEAAEIDGVARVAIALNAAANGAAVTVCDDDPMARPGCPWPGGPWDVVAAGDVCYEKPMTDRMMPWLRACAAAGAFVVIADPGRSYLPKSGLERLAAYTVPTSLDLEDRTHRDTVVYRVLPV